MTRSEQLFERAVKRIPGGVNSPVRSYGAIGEAPRFIEKADKCYIYDVDGNRYVDYIDSWGPMILGHNFPFYMKFKGGKGIAVMAALTVSNCFWHLPYSVLMFFITLAFFAVPVAVTRYISLGSLLAYAAFFIEMVVFGQLGWFGMEQAYLYELYILVFLLTALAWWRHRANIRRLLNGTENKFGSGKSKSKEG